MFPEDLPAETQRERDTRIPIKPGNKPPHQALSGKPKSIWRSMGWSTQVIAGLTLEGLILLQD
jgi:hypothetical protein